MDCCAIVCQNGFIKQKLQITTNAAFQEIPQASFSLPEAPVAFSLLCRCANADHAQPSRQRKSLQYKESTDVNLSSCQWRMKRRYDSCTTNQLQVRVGWQGWQVDVLKLLPCLSCQKLISFFLMDDRARAYGLNIIRSSRQTASDQAEVQGELPRIISQRYAALHYMSRRLVYDKIPDSKVNGQVTPILNPSDQLRDTSQPCLMKTSH